MTNKTLMTDFYELTMSQTYFEQNKQDEVVYFDVFFRKNPFNGGYTIAAGLDNIIEYINNFKITDLEIEYLKSLNKFSDSFLMYLKDLKFTGNISAVPDGTVVFPNEPVITVCAKVIEAQIIETALLTNFNYASLVATSAKRITTAANNIPVMEFGARRARGMEAAVEASKYAYIGGCVGTSNTLAGMLYNIPVMGTMAHSLVTESDSEYEAFLGYAKSNPTNCVFLVDTYDTLNSGVPNAIKVAHDYLIPNGYKLNGIRIDSGDLAYDSKMARIILNEAGLKNTKICLSNGLDENTINDLILQGAVIDSIGAGDNIAAAKERIGGVYKLCAIKKENSIIPKIKVSNTVEKIINPGYKKTYRFYDKTTGYALGDVIALHDEIISEDKYVLIDPNATWKQTILTNYIVKELQEPIFIDGVQVYKDPAIEEKRKYAEECFKTIYPEIKRTLNPHSYYVDLSEELLELKNKMIKEIKTTSPNKVKTKEKHYA